MYTNLWHIINNLQHYTSYSYQCYHNCNRYTIPPLQVTTMVTHQTVQSMCCQYLPFSTSALMLIVRNRSSSFSYSIPRDALLSRVRFGLRVASRRRDRNMDDVPAGGAIPPPNKPNTTSANLTLLHNSGGRQAAAAEALLRDATRRRFVQCYYYAGHVRDVFWCGAVRTVRQRGEFTIYNVLPLRRLKCIILLSYGVMNY